MARTSLLDHLQNFAFHLVDAAPIEVGALPLFTPSAGFSAISAPEVSVELSPIPEGNRIFPRQAVVGGEVSSITLSRGASAFDGDFWRWIVSAIRGSTLSSGVVLGGPTYRRDMILMQFFVRLPIPGGPAAAGLIADSVVTGLTAALNPGSVVGAVTAGLAGAADLAVQGISRALGTRLSENAVRVPARAWVLKGCLPKRYKVGGDFEGTSADVSIMELELQPEDIEELTLMS